MTPVPVVHPETREAATTNTTIDEKKRVIEILPTPTDLFVLL
jgi:hypothetical protein